MAFRNFRNTFSLVFLSLAVLVSPGEISAFTTSSQSLSWSQVRLIQSDRFLAGQANVLAATSQETESEDSTSPLQSEQENKVYELLKDLHTSDIPFRIVVVGNGAILESTNPLGPTFKVGESPKTGASIVTFASEDQSFEFHLMPAQIASAVLVERQNPKGKTLRLLRLLNAEGGSICSLIVADDSEAAQSWYKDLSDRYGSDIAF